MPYLAIKISCAHTRAGNSSIAEILKVGVDYRTSLSSLLPYQASIQNKHLISIIWCTLTVICGKEMVDMCFTL